MASAWSSSIDETFTILEGCVGISIDGERFIAKPGRKFHVPRGTAHDWWNAGDEEAHLLVEITPAAPIAKLKGYRGRYPEYEARAPIHVLSEESPGLMPLAS